MNEAPANSSPSDVIQNLGNNKNVLLCDVSVYSFLPTSLKKQVKAALEGETSFVLVVDLQWMSPSMVAPAHLVATELWKLGSS